MPTTPESVHKKSLEDESSWFSFISMAYLDNLFVKGSKDPLELEDLGGISEGDKSNPLYKKFLETWEEGQKEPKKPMLWVILWRTVGWWKFYVAMSLFALSAVIGFGPVLILNVLVKYFEGSIHLTVGVVWVYVCLLFILPTLSSVLLTGSNNLMAHVGAQMRNVLIGAIYRKSLVLSSSSRQTISTGKIMTMFSADTNQIRGFLFFACNTLIAPLQITLCLYFIYQQVGVSTFVGLGFTALTIPLNALVFGKGNSLKREKMTFTDMRVKLMNEVLNGIRIIKYYSWESAFFRKISMIRSDELRKLLYQGYLINGAFALLLIGAPQIQTILIFFTYISLGNDLNASIAFTTLALFNMMTSPFIFLPMGLQQFSMSLVSTKRISDFLSADELENYIETLDETSSGNEDCAIRFENASLSWASEKDIASIESSNNNKKDEYVPLNESEEVPEEVSTLKNRNIHTLSDITLNIKKKSLVGIVGPVGCGKSSLFSAILGEMHKVSGTVSISKDSTFSYCEQRPWVVNASIKDNILFGNEYDEVKFKRAIYSACMEDDLKLFSDGILTEIGERGINMSGGQKARVALARAVYNDADIYLLDDPLSAVDAHVGEHLMSKCIKEALSEKTVLLVTHQIHVLPKCDTIVIVEDGKIKVSGSYTEIMASGIDLSRYFPTEEEADGEKEEEVTEEEAVLRERGESLANNKHRASSAASAQEEDKAAKGTDLMSKEEKAIGSVDMNAYRMYVAKGGTALFGYVILTQLSSQIINILSSFWLAYWGKESTNRSDAGENMSYHDNVFYLNIFAALIMGSVSLMFVQRISLVNHRSIASASYHSQLLRAVLYTPVSFFDVTPIGRVINRFSQDMAIIDEILAQSLSQFIGVGGLCIGAIGAILGATKGTFLAIIIPLGVIYGKIQTFFKASNTAIARIESITRSPIYADFSQVLGGVSTVRAYKQQPRFIHDLETYSNTNTIPGVYQQIAGQWLALRLDVLGSLITFFMGALAVASKGSNFVSAGDLGIGLTYSIGLTGLLKMAIRVSATLEANMNSVERFNHYINTLEVEGMREEPTDVTQEGKSMDAIEEGDIKLMSLPPLVTPPSDWPTEGRIEFRNVSMRYRDGPLVLKNISCVVQGREKIGFCGRTGCGKSSLMVSLFRIEELAGGCIFIDDVDIASVPLPTLRKNLSIIPQDPVMFSSTVRFNLDPFNEFNDMELWDVLEHVNMKPYVESLPSKLEEMVAEGGDNFSVGQRQLICIARALLRKPKILVMDEATASIDSETDAFIQRMIRDKFKDCTVLTIAHRLDTIFDSDKIAVLDSGVLKEYESAQTLLSSPRYSLFKGLWERHLQETKKKKK